MIDTGLALSVRQPFAWAILEGIKKKEYRSRPSHVRGRVYIYAGKKYRNDPFALKHLKGTSIQVEDLPRGAILGTVEIVDCKVDKKNGYAWILENPKIFRKPREFSGTPNAVFWRPKF